MTTPCCSRVTSRGKCNKMRSKSCLECVLLGIKQPDHCCLHHFSPRNYEFKHTYICIGMSNNGIMCTKKVNSFGGLCCLHKDQTYTLQPIERDTQSIHQPIQCESTEQQRESIEPRSIKSKFRPLQLRISAN